jgi:hypothetical protein
MRTQQLKESQEKYYRKHAEYLKTKATAWNRKNKAARKRIAAKWQRNNPDLVNTNHREWMGRNPEVRRANEASRRARKEGNGGDYSPEAWMALKKEYHSRCLCCGLCEKKLKLLGRKLVPDHVVPIKLGGTNFIRNIQPLCHGLGGCNNKKGINTTDYRKK